MYPTFIAGVYSKLSENDGLVDYLDYDISEIDPAASRRAKQTPASSASNSDATMFGISSSEKSVLEIICGSPPVEGAFKLLQNPVVKQIISKKWEKYRWWVWITGLFYFMFLSLLIVYTVNKCQVILLKNNASVFDGRIIDGQMILGQAQEHFVLALSIVFFLISLGLFTWEILRIRRGYWYHFDLAHHNGVYRILLILLAIGLSGDSVW